MKISSMSWVTLHVSDLEESVQFYNTQLGLPIERKLENVNNKIVFLGGADSAKIELLCEGGEKVENAGRGITVGFCVEELDREIERLKGVVKGKIVGPIAPNPHIRFYMVPDPDGYQIQLYENT